MAKTNPATWTMTIGETEILPLDPTPLFSPGQTSVNPTSTLENLDTQAMVTLANAPTIVDNIINQEIVGGTDVTEPGNYRLTCCVTCYPSPNVRCLELLLTVVP